MDIISIEIKSKINDPKRIEMLLKAKNARFVGEDHQIDTYFITENNHLKLRHGKIENALIFYERPETKDLKRSKVKLQKLPKDNEEIKDILNRILGIKTIVDKKRKIYFIENVKFHIDEVQGLGSFVEIEALDTKGDLTEKHLKEQCEYYINYLKLDREQLVDKSYCEMESKKIRLIEID